MSNRDQSLTSECGTRKIAIYSFFSCSGFLDLGFELAEGAPYAIRMANEIDANFRRCYKYSRAHLKNPIDVPADFIFSNSIEDFILRNNAPKKNKDKIYSSFTALLQGDRAQRNIIGFIGGPPCPDFSIAGKNLGQKGKVGPLSSRYISLIRQERPDFFLFENVKGLYKSASHRKYFNYISGLLNKDYLIDPQVVNALWYGVPQYRERLIMIGVKKQLLGDMTKREFHDALRWEVFQPYKSLISNVKWPSARTSIDHWAKSLPEKIRLLTVEKCWESRNVTNHPNHQNQTRQRPATVAKIARLPEGNATGKSYHRLSRYKYAFTAAYGHNEVPIHPVENRRISVAEALATQSLPTDFAFPTDIGISALYKAVGNGVPYLMAKGLAEMIFNFLKEKLPERLT